MNRRSGAPPPALLIAANLAVDVVTAEVVEALRGEGVASILLKGPAIYAWLYGEETEAPRTYDDVDLLVPPEPAERSHRVLAGLGFANRFAEFAAGESVEHSSEWWRPGSAVAVDLHRTLFGAKADPAELWQAFASDADRLVVAGAEVDVPSHTGLALIVALHAAHHGVDETKPLRDLSRAIERADFALWDDAARLAERISATPAFAAGLLLTDHGGSIAERLGIADAVDTEAALLARSPAPTAYGYARLAATPGIRRKLAFLARKLVPTPAFMRHAFPIARRGRIGLAIAYLWRPLWLLAHAGPGLIAWMRARR
jgi:Uncharacterised nucleotidyltransferase